MSRYINAVVAALKLSHRAFTEGMKDVPAGDIDPGCAKLRVEAKRAVRAVLDEMGIDVWGEKK